MVDEIGDLVDELEGLAREIPVQEAYEAAERRLSLSPVMSLNSEYI